MTGSLKILHGINFIKNCEGITRNKCWRNSFSKIALENKLFMSCSQDGEVGRPEFTSFQGHTKITNIYRATLYKSDRSALKS